MGFFLIIFIWKALWLSWNMLVSKQLRFDPYAAFVLWLFISKMIQLFLMPLIMLGQNIQAALENETILLHLENQNKIMLKILKVLETKN
jgi:uncharacterized membrane protein